MFKLPKLWCAATLKTSIGNCPKDVKRFRFSCLACRIRRYHYGRFTEPKFYAKYTFKNITLYYRVNSYERDGYRYHLKSGKKMLITRYHFLLVDPRGHFLMWRLATIKVLDHIIGWTGFRYNHHKTIKGFITKSKRTKPFAEWAELLANYPVW